jgi:hypothetical protein
MRTSDIHVRSSSPQYFSLTSVAHALYVFCAELFVPEIVLKAQQKRTLIGQLKWTYV